MARFENRRPLTEDEQKTIALRVVLKSDPKILVVNHPKVLDRGAAEVANLIRVPTDQGDIDVCPWCEAHHPSVVFDRSRLFWHGNQLRAFACERPSWQYTPAECGQRDYDRESF